MLIQYGNGSGHFNGKQIELIKNLKLPILRSHPGPPIAELRNSAQQLGSAFSQIGKGLRHKRTSSA